LGCLLLCLCWALLLVAGLAQLLAEAGMLLQHQELLAARHAHQSLYSIKLLLPRECQAELPEQQLLLLQAAQAGMLSCPPC
jgi:hypothetical protein